MKKNTIIGLIVGAIALAGIVAGVSTFYSAQNTAAVKTEMEQSIAKVNGDVEKANKDLSTFEEDLKESAETSVAVVSDRASVSGTLDVQGISDTYIGSNGRFLVAETRGTSVDESKPLFNVTKEAARISVPLEASEVSKVGNINSTGTLSVASITSASNGNFVIGTDGGATFSSVKTNKDGSFGGKVAVSDTLTAGNESFSVAKVNGAWEMVMKGIVTASELNTTGKSAFKDTVIDGNLTVTGTTALQNGLAVTGNAGVTNNLNVGNDATINNDLTVKGKTNLGGDLNVTGKSVFADSMKTKDIDTTAGTLTAGTTTTGVLTASSIQSTGNFGVGSDAYSTSKFKVEGTTGNTGITGTLSVADASTFNGLLTASQGVSIANGATITGTTTTGDLNSQALTATSIQSSGDFNINSGKFSVASVTGDTNVGGELNVTGAVTAGSISTNAITPASGTFTVNGTLAASSIQSTGNFAVNTNKFTVDASTGNASIAGTLAVLGNTTVGGDLTVTGESIFTGGIGVGSAFKGNVTLTAGSTSVSVPAPAGYTAIVNPTSDPGQLWWVTNNTIHVSSMASDDVTFSYFCIK